MTAGAVAGSDACLLLFVRLPAALACARLVASASFEMTFAVSWRCLYWRRVLGDVKSTRSWYSDSGEGGFESAMGEMHGVPPTGEPSTLEDCPLLREACAGELGERR